MARVIETDHVVELVGWEAMSVSLDGTGHAAQLRRIDNAWALMIDLPTLVIGACGQKRWHPSNRS